jgi:hypothetical protein
MPPDLDPATEDARVILRIFLAGLLLTILGVALIAAC